MASAPEASACRSVRERAQLRVERGGGWKSFDNDIVRVFGFARDFTCLGVWERGHARMHQCVREKPTGPGYFINW